jgi:CubicO group peptidase (beta-lactamase class C family)
MLHRRDGGVRNKSQADRTAHLSEHRGSDRQGTPAARSHGPSAHAAGHFCFWRRCDIAAAKAGTLKPSDATDQNPSYAFAAGGVISTADDLATWMHALVGGKVFDAAYQRQWLDSPEPQDPGAPEGQSYGYGISLMTFGPNRVYFHGGEMPGYNSFMGYDPVNDVTLII